MIKVGMKCTYLDPFNIKREGKILCVDGNTFTAYDGSKCPPQYNDSFRDFTEEDIGKTIWFGGTNE